MIWGNFLGKILLDIFRDEVSQMSARLSAGQGAQKLFGQFPNAQVMKLEGASLRVFLFEFVLGCYSINLCHGVDPFNGVSPCCTCSVCLCYGLFLFCC